MYDPLVDLYDDEPLRAIKPLPAEETNALLASALETTTNPLASRALVAAVFQRELPKGESVAMREALRYISTVENYATKQPTKHIDLLPTGHPLGTDNQVTRNDIAEYFSSTFANDEDRDLVYEIISNTPNSVERDFAVGRIQPHQYAIIAAVQAASEMTPAEEQDWDQYAEYMATEEPGEDFAYVSLDEDGNEILVRPEITKNLARFTGTVVFPMDPEKNTETTRYDE
jgi:hypothetical protein